MFEVSVSVVTCDVSCLKNNNTVYDTRHCLTVVLVQYQFYSTSLLSSYSLAS